MKTIYCIKDDNNKIIYVGQTKNFQRRRWEHRYRKHLPKTYTFEIIEECEDSQAIEKERYYIKLYDTVEKGLNIVYGNGQFGIKGADAGFGGRFQKHNKAWQNRVLKKVKCIETGIVYNSAKECAKDMGIKDSCRINNVCNGYRKSYHKYHFEYIE